MSNKDATQQNAALYIREYAILQSNIASNLSEKVNASLKEGWILHGELFVTPDGTYTQQVVKPDQRVMDIAEFGLNLVGEQIAELGSFR